ncbi:MAG: NAD-dependent epimerase/dehydratase family protein, partial [Actinomycetota bacterium]
MLVAVTGASGLIGTALTRRLRAEGHQVLRLTRSRPTGADQAQWDPAAGQLDPEALAKADAVVHLAAKHIGDQLRWTARTKRQILQTRVEGTALVARTMAGLAEGPGGPRVLVCASGAHYYGDRGDEVLTEASSGGRGFLAGVVR